MHWLRFQAYTPNYRNTYLNSCNTTKSCFDTGHSTVELSHITDELQFSGAQCVCSLCGAAWNNIAFSQHTIQVIRTHTTSSFLAPVLFRRWKQGSGGKSGRAAGGSSGPRAPHKLGASDPIWLLGPSKYLHKRYPCDWMCEIARKQTADSRVAQPRPW